MLDFPRWKRVWLWPVTLVFALAAVPSLVSLTGASWPAALPQPMVNLGLDLAGGSHILLEADTAPGRRASGSRRWRRRSAPRCATPSRASAIGDISTAGRRSVASCSSDPSQVDAARDALEPLTTGAGLTGQRDWDDRGRRRQPLRADARPRPGSTLAVDKAMDSATEVVRKRIDALGTREPTIIRQGDDRIVVQVPGPAGSAGAQGPARPDRQARVQAGRPDRAARATSRRASPRRAARSCPARRAATTQGQPHRGAAARRHPRRLADRRAGRRFDPQTNEPVVSDHVRSAGRRAVRRADHARTSASRSPSSSTARCSRRPTSTSRSSAAARRSRAASPSRPPTSWRSRCARARCRWT